MLKSTLKQDSRDLCKKLVNAREEANLTQKQVSASGILSQSELSKIENGQRKIDFLLLIRLAKLYRKSIEYFLPNKYCD